MGEHLYTYIDPPNERHLDQITAVLKRGGIIALSTGTSWAFCVDPSSKKALEKVIRLRPNHPEGLPFSLVCRDISMASQVGTIGGQAYRFLHRVFPGPYTVLLFSQKKLPKLLGSKRTTVGVRIPDAPLCQAIIERFGGPLLVSSVPPGPNGVLTMGWELFESYGHALDYVIDLGEEVPGLKATVVDLTMGEPVVVREGVGSTDF